MLRILVAHLAADSSVANSPSSDGRQCSRIELRKEKIRPRLTFAPTTSTSRYASLATQTDILTRMGAAGNGAGGTRSRVYGMQERRVVPSLCFLSLQRAVSYPLIR